MLIEALLTMLAVAAPQKPPAVFAAPASALAAASSPAYRPEARAVDNWRVESALALEMAPVAAVRRAVGAEEGEPARCVKLNNYWCIKSAGWSGEIAADSDGHVAFASAEEGAAVAALLLRRYYVDYGRRTARAIVERWAPAQCFLVGALAGMPASRAGIARMPPQRIVTMGLAPRGIRNTLRARWLAAHGRGGVNSKTARAPLRAPVDLMPAPSIMAGVSELPARREKFAELIRPAPQTTIADLAPTPAPRPAPDTGVSSCGGERARIANYAASIAQGVVGGPDEDLGLFTAAGLPTENLVKAMANMAAVEIGPGRPRDALIRVAVAQLRRTLEKPGDTGSVTPSAPSQTQSTPADQERAISSSARP
ncbi:hypothetical protein [Methylocystis sp.]|uniref:hypothetical protein n=1 Tax=Methylocystis sp. TaxID=1911079 RepID=UPI0026013862|nr:hypothetical protein [Methylocystis sp.]